MRRPVQFFFVRLSSQRVSNSKPDTAQDNREGSKKVNENVKEGLLLINTCGISIVDELWIEDDNRTGKSSGESLKFPEYGNKPKGPEPTRFGDWQYKGRSTDF